MKLSEYESLIKSQVEDNCRNPEIYNNLQKMIKLFLMRKKACRCYEDYEEISYLLAGDIFIRIYQGENFSRYLGYLDKIYHKYVFEYYGKNDKEYIYFDDLSDFIEFKSLQSQDDYSFVRVKMYLENIEGVINEVMDQSCKYDPETPDFINLKISLLLTILRKEEINFHLSNDQIFYLKMIVKNFYSKVFNNVKNGEIQ